MDCSDPKIVSSIKRICLILLLVLILVDLLLFLVYPPYVHPHFEEYTSIDKYSFVFYPLVGLLACCLLVVVSVKIIGQVLERKDTYYDD